MRQHAGVRSIVSFLCIGLLLSGCYGPFNLTRRLHHWNGQVGGRWANEVVFLCFIWLPVYSLATLGDGLIFNSVEFWTGNNPVSPPTAEAPRTTTKTLAQGDQKVILQRVDAADGRQMHVQIYTGDRLTKEFSVEAKLDQPTVMKDATGAVMGSAQTLPDGTLVLHDAAGVEQARYSPQQMDRLAKKYEAASTRQ